MKCYDMLYLLYLHLILESIQFRMLGRPRAPAAGRAALRGAAPPALRSAAFRRGTAARGLPLDAAAELRSHRPGGPQSARRRFGGGARLLLWAGRLRVAGVPLRQGPTKGSKA